MNDDRERLMALRGQVAPPTWGRVMTKAEEVLLDTVMSNRGIGIAVNAVYEERLPAGVFEQGVKLFVAKILAYRAVNAFYATLPEHKGIDAFWGKMEQEAEKRLK